MKLTNKSIVVTGASSGMGKAIVELFVKEGANVIAVARRTERLAALAESLKDEAGKMNRSLLDMGGQILAISQFTLLGDARGGRRPSFITAARPDTAVPLYEALVEKWRSLGIHVETGEFGADMQVSHINDGPVTILLDSRRLF